MGLSPGAAGVVFGRGHATALHARRRQLQRDRGPRRRLWQRSGAHGKVKQDKVEGPMKGPWHKQGGELEAVQEPHGQG